MRSIKSLVLAIPLLALGVSHAGDAAAFGGCFHEAAAQPSAIPAVTGHRIILSVAPTKTTLWDQLSYTGTPSSFAWVLPIKGTVEVGLSSDALFDNLDTLTRMNVGNEGVTCLYPSSCVYGGATGTGFVLGSGTATNGPYPVTAYASAVVGPYQTVQLHSSDPTALTAWLAANGFAIPDDAKAIIATYVGEGFDFLALKLVPGMPATAIRPVRVTTPGTTPVLPLRMTAIGAPTTLPTTVWVMGPGRYEATNMPDFTITSDQLTWDYAKNTSNYAALLQASFDASPGKTWHIEGAEPFAPKLLQDTITALAKINAGASGYGAGMDSAAPKEAEDDLAALFGELDPTSLWMTRLQGQLGQQAFSADLTLGLSAMQTPVSRDLTISKTTGVAPVCPVNPPCAETTSAGATGTAGTSGAGGSSSSGGGSSSSGGGSSSCAMARDGGSPSMLGALSVLAAMALLRRRRWSLS